MMYEGILQNDGEKMAAKDCGFAKCGMWIASRIPLSVAGYTPSIVSFNFIDVGGELALAGVRVTIGHVDAFDNIKKTLVSELGAGDTDEEKKYIKLGKNNTAVYLDTDGGFVNLILGKTDAVNTLELVLPDNATYEKSILFQEIPWGSSVEEIQNWAKKMGFAEGDVSKVEYLPHIVYMDASGYAIEEGASRLGDYRDKFCGLHLRKPPMKIAGYDDYDLNFYFAENGKHTALITVAIEFGNEYGAGQQVIDDLKTKLNTVYGVNQAKKVTSEYMRLGQDNTAIHLRRNGILTSVLLIYGKTDAYAGELEREQPAVDASDVSGL